MSRRLKVTLDQDEENILEIRANVLSYSEVADISVEEWSDFAVEKMFEAAEDALKDNNL